MNTQNQNGYMLLFRGNDWTKSLSPEEKQKVTDQWMAWFRRLTDQGKAIAGNPLEPEGKIVSGKNPWCLTGRLRNPMNRLVAIFFLASATSMIRSLARGDALALRCVGQVKWRAGW